VNTGLDWTTVTTEKFAGMAAIVNQEQQRVVVGLGNWHLISVRQVSYDADTMQRGTCGHAAQLLMLLCVGSYFHVYYKLWCRQVGRPNL